jgi:GR25 family glycosyltransferase involved in LPS biosynthesis
LRRIADGDDDVALIFEDDIDMEWDLEKRLRYLWKFLPDKAWDQVMIGPLGIYFGQFKQSHS